MASSLFPPQSSGIPNGLQNVLRLAQGNPKPLFDHLVRTNPRFAQFVAQNGSKGPEQAFRDNGLDWSQVSGMLH